jgi:hypothetical protein
LDSRLLYNDGSAWKPLPEWARFYIALGGIVGDQVPGRERLIVGVVAPTRAYAAALVALGLVAARARVALSEVDTESHLRYIRSLPVGTHVYYFQSGKKRKAIFLGSVSFPSHGNMLKLQFESTPGARQSGGLIEYLPPGHARHIRLAETEFQLPRRQSAVTVVRTRPFVESVLGEADVDEFAYCARTECLIVGTAAVLSEEITSTAFAAATQARPGPKGVLNEILRVRRFLPHDEPYRSEVRPCLTQSPGPGTALGPIHTVVFDSALAFLQFRGEYKRSHWVMLLDRFDPHIREAADAFSAGYIEDRIGDQSVQGDLPGPVPPGLELSAYRERLA